MVQMCGPAGMHIHPGGCEAWGQPSAEVASSVFAPPSKSDTLERKRVNPVLSYRLKTAIVGAETARVLRLQTGSMSGNGREFGPLLHLLDYLSCGSGIKIFWPTRMDLALTFGLALSTASTVTFTPFC